MDFSEENVCLIDSEEPEAKLKIRKPSKTRYLSFISILLVLLLLTLTAAFIVLYMKKGVDSSCKSGSGICTSPGCFASAAGIVEKLDQSTKPCDDFYQYSCGGFLKRTRLRKNEFLKDSFIEGKEFVEQALKRIFEDEGLMSNYSKDQNSAVYKAFVFYKSCMDENYISNAGMKPILDMIEKYGSWNITNEDWSEDSWYLERTLARMKVDLSTVTFVDAAVIPNIFDITKPNTIFVAKAGQNLGTQGKGYSYYKFPQSLRTVRDVNDQTWRPLTSRYKTFMLTVFKLLGASDNIQLYKDVERINQLEQDFNYMYEEDVPSFMNTNELKKHLKIMTLQELNNHTSFKFNWTMYFEEIFRGSGRSFHPSDRLMVLVPNNLKNVVDFITGKPKSLLASTMMWNAIQRLLPTLPLKMRKAENNYKEYLSPTNYNSHARWKTCLSLTHQQFTYVASLLYMNENVPEESINMAKELFTEMKKEFLNGLNEQEWLDDKTRASARRKLIKIKENFGYLQFIKDPAKLNKFYEEVKVNISQLLQNQLSSVRNTFMKQIQLFGKLYGDNTVNTYTLFHQIISPLAANAFYFGVTNEIYILAGVLRPPFYHKDSLR
ncbi:membrane metallo-endopeptidase-like 1 [Dendronephthya gigantea]|uniref:membrane metallo-endopeptidase-like 1 n=1 Tax=Dendronephthya gigantea TaxID=151771 RepID=UPI00106C408C|nr:membrane metallo-endopeptidase-like 1 [Dendronephthya gigantea]